MKLTQMKQTTQTTTQNILKTGVKIKYGKRKTLTTICGYPVKRSFC